MTMILIDRVKISVSNYNLCVTLQENYFQEVMNIPELAGLTLALCSFHR